MRNKKKKTPLYQIIVFLLLLCLLATLGLAYWHYEDSLKPIQPNSETVTFTVEKGATLRQVCADLEAQGIIKNDKMAFYYARFNHLNDIKAGDFNLDKSWSVNEIFTFLNDELAANVDTVNITIIPGDWAKDIARKIGAETNVTAEELLALWNDESYIREMMEIYPFLTEEIFNDQIKVKLEGYLAPNTYQFYRETNPQEVTKRLLDETLKVYTQFASDIQESEFSIHQIFTLASIVQYEAGSNMDDMRLVSGVFYNRLNIDMPLQASATVCYAMNFEKDTDDWHVCETNGDVDDPFNTYKYPGLTPGPIQNASANAFDAALHPTESDYIYFMTEVSTGTFHYAKTLEEHNANVAQYME